MLDMDPITYLNATIQALARQLSSHPLNVNAIQGYGRPQCGMCGAMGHLSNQCYEGNQFPQSYQPFQGEPLNYAWNQQGPQYNDHWNSYSNSYNPEWGTHPSFGWESHQYQQAPFQEPNPSYYSNSWGPTGSSFQDFEQNSYPQPQYKQEEMGMDLEDMVRMCMEENQEMKKAFQDLSIQVGQLGQLFHNGPQDAFYSDIEMNSREANVVHVKDVYLKIENDMVAIDQNKKGVDLVGQTLFDGLLSHENDQVEGLLHQEPKIFEVKASLKHSLEKLEPKREEPLVEFMKKIEEVEPVYLSEECSSLFNKLPPKIKDPGTFSIPCTIGSNLSRSFGALKTKKCRKLPSFLRWGRSGL